MNTKKTVKALKLVPAKQDKEVHSKALKVVFGDDDKIEYFMPAPMFVHGPAMSGPLKLGMMISRKWPSTKSEFRIKFINGDADIYAKVMQDWKTGIQAKINAAGNQAFNFIQVTTEPDFIVSFTQNNQSWSYVGTDCGYIAKAGMTTMNLGWAIRYRNNEYGERYGTACHEMLHALGYIHTLQSPACTGILQWNKDVVYAKYARIGWTKDMVDQNVFNAYPADQINDNGCDFQSIMCYSVSPGEANVIVGRNNAFSALDDAKIKMDYGKGVIAPPPPPPVDTTTLVSQGKPCSQSSLYSAVYPASNAVDGNNNTFQHTQDEQKPWWEVDLGAVYDISKITILNRQGCCQYRTRKFKVFVTNAPVNNYTQKELHLHEKQSGFNEVVLDKLTAKGRYVRVWIDNFNVPNWMHLAEVKVWGTIAASQPKAKPKPKPKAKAKAKK